MARATQPTKGTPAKAKGAAKPAASAPPPVPAPTEEDRKWAFAAHLGALVFGALAPLLVLTRRRGAWVNAHARDSLNFQLTMHCVELAGVILTVVTVGGLIVVVAWGVSVILSVFAGARAWSGAPARYPFSIKFLKA